MRAGKYIELELAGTSRDSAELRIREICDKLLANPVIEDFRYEINAE